jgi:hypothetical protein
MKLMLLTSLLALASLASGQVSQRDEDQAAQSASQKGADEQTEAADGFANFQAAAQGVEATAEIVLEGIADAVVGDASAEDSDPDK